MSSEAAAPLIACPNPHDFMKAAAIADKTLTGKAVHKAASAIRGGGAFGTLMIQTLMCSKTRKATNWIAVQKTNSKKKASGRACGGQPVRDPGSVAFQVAWGWKQLAMS